MRSELFLRFCHKVTLKSLNGCVVLPILLLLEHILVEFFANVAADGIVVYSYELVL